MRKFAILGFLCIVSIIFAACSNHTDEKQDECPFLYDLDHMMYILENNFALFDVVYWARGYDLRAMAESARNEIIGANYINNEIFLQILRKNMSFDAAHFAIGTFGGSNFSPERLAATFQMSQETHQEIPRAIIARTIKEGEIAHLAMPSFLLSTLEEQVLDFLHEVRDYDHLIIDLRGNRGGWVSNFWPIVRPNIAEALVAVGYGFVQYGPHIEGAHLPIPRNSPTHIIGGGGPLIADRDFTPIMDFLENVNLPELRESDMYRMDYAFRFEVRIFPRNLDEFDFLPAFNGKIWLLVCESNSSAAQLAIWFVKETGFATIVGEITGGHLGGARTVAHLPNSMIWFQFDMGYITDSNGRPLEAGTIPHHFNRPGMNALQTVLALIEEGDH